MGGLYDTIENFEKQKMKAKNSTRHHKRYL